MNIADKGQVETMRIAAVAMGEKTDKYHLNLTLQVILIQSVQLHVKSLLVILMIPADPTAQVVVLEKHLEMEGMIGIDPIEVRIEAEIEDSIEDMIEAWIEGWIEEEIEGEGARETLDMKEAESSKLVMILHRKKPQGFRKWVRIYSLIYKL